MFYCVHLLVHLVSNGNFDVFHVDNFVCLGSYCSNGSNCVATAKEGEGCKDAKDENSTGDAGKINVKQRHEINVNVLVAFPTSILTVAAQAYSLVGDAVLGCRARAVVNGVSVRGTNEVVDGVVLSICSRTVVESFRPVETHLSANEVCFVFTKDIIANVFSSVHDYSFRILSEGAMSREERTASNRCNMSCKQRTN